jgi:hypothetical protein
MKRIKSFMSNLVTTTINKMKIKKNMKTMKIMKNMIKMELKKSKK